MKDLCKMYEMKMNNLLVDVEIFSLCHKEALFYVKDLCKMYEMKMNNLLVDVEIFLLCHKEALFQAKFQQYKWKSWSSFLADEP